MFALRHAFTALGVSASLGALAAGCDLPAPNDAEIGCTYDAQSSSTCPGYAASAAAPDASKDAAASSDAAPNDGEAGSLSPGLGEACTTSADCSGYAADYCLVSPTGTFSSFCTYTHCTAALCGASYGCCDCTASTVSQLTQFPPGICVPPTTAAALPAYGCTCASQ